MKRPPHLSRLGSLLLMLLFMQGFLACDHPSPPQKTESASREFYESHGWTVRLSDNSERVTSLVGGRSKPFAGAPVERASQFLRENQRLLGLEQSDLSDLKVLEARENHFGTNVEFQQVFKGLPVENGRIKINFDKEGRVLHVVSSYAPTAGSSDRVDRSKEQAAETATAEFLRTTPVYASKLDEQEQTKAVFVARCPFKKSAPKVKVDDVYFVRKDRLHRAFKTFISAVKPFGIKEIITDAQDDAVLQVRDFVYTYTDGEGQVFRPNPVNSQNNPSLRDNDTISSHNPNPYYTFPLRELDVPTDGPFKLQGRFVILRDIEAPENTPPESDNGKFIYERNEPGFEDVMVYYHIDRIQRYIQSLGFIDVMNEQLAVDAHGNDGADNSHYVGSSGSSIGRPYIAFGDGGVDDAEDGDAIAHEYGHAIQDNQAPGKYGILNKQTKAMGEGFGDYWAVSSFRDETKESGHLLPCVMEWDKVLNICLRRVDTALTASDFKYSASNHINGQIWSATLYDIFNKFDDKADADKLILQSHFNVNDGPSFKDGADAILTADWQLFSGSHITQLCEVFTGRKIYESSECSNRPAATGDVTTPGVIRLLLMYLPL